MEITVECEDGREAHHAIHVAFESIARVQTLMSFHDLGSEISELNRLAFFQNVAVSPETYEVLKRAKKLYEYTDGIFDITIAAELMDWDLLPRHSFLSQTDFSGRTKDIELLPNRQVHFLRPLCIDLGGIAKGFAVDRAIQVLQERDMQSAIVNAGGDIRCFGNQERPIWVRDPQLAGQFLSLPALKNAALATSANSYDKLRRDSRICPHVHGQTRKPLPSPSSVSVRADSCMMADALTKVVIALGKDSGEILSHFNAVAFIAGHDGRMICYGGRQS
ncbi:MAG: FAD:protein FMN transferase [Candidatus Omnitrophica bacterium]|nr:FAD:protein FMN transferase [Candidatus Omnitrophota bacterium]